MSFIKALPASFIAFFMAAGAQAQQPLTPPQVTELFIGTLVHTDPAAMKLLNDYQRPARVANGNEGDFIDIEKMLETDAIYAQHVSKAVLRQVKLNDEDKAILQPDVVLLLQTIRDAQKRTLCTTGAVEPITQGVRAGYKTVTVEFACKAINPSEKLTTVLRRAHADGWNTLEQYRRAVTTLTQDYKNAPLTQDFNGKFPLSSKDSDTLWQNIFPRESLDISKALF